MHKKNKKIVLIGGPGTGKTTVLEKLKSKGFYCLEEVSREVTLKAQKQGIEQLFLTKPLLFSEMLLEGRIEQYKLAEKSTEENIFFDRGIPDVEAYLDFLNTDYPLNFKTESNKYKYDYIFQFAPWKEIYITDNERYESFEESLIIDKHLTNTYKNLNYKVINVPFGNVEERTNFILNLIE